MSVAGIGALPALVAQGGPVVPEFEQGSDCVRENQGFCWDWFDENSTDVFADRADPAHRADRDRGEHRLRDRVRGARCSPTARAARRRRSTIFFAFLYTIPSLALFQLMVPSPG